MSDDPTGAELIAARDRIKRQIEILENPIRASDAYPDGIVKLRAALAEIESCLAGIRPRNA